MMNAKEILEAIAPDANEYETETARIKAMMDALCDGEALASIGCTDDDQLEVEEAYSILNEQLDRAEARENKPAEA